MFIWLCINISLFVFGLGFFIVRSNKKMEGFWLDPYGGLAILFLFVPISFVMLNSFLYPLLVGWKGYQFVFSPVLIVLVVLFIVYVTDFIDNRKFRKYDIPVHIFAKECIEKQGFLAAEKCRVKMSTVKKKEDRLEGDIFVSIPIEFEENLAASRTNIQKSFQEKYPYIIFRIVAMRE